MPGTFYLKTCGSGFDGLAAVAGSVKVAANKLKILRAYFMSKAQMTWPLTGCFFERAGAALAIVENDPF
jgi:hypothetical protein